MIILYTWYVPLKDRNDRYMVYWVTAAYAHYKYSHQTD